MESHPSEREGWDFYILSGMKKTGKVVAGFIKANPISALQEPWKISTSA